MSRFKSSLLGLVIVRNDQESARHSCQPRKGNDGGLNGALDGGKAIVYSRVSNVSVDLMLVTDFH
jgi:hypothetical protein